MIDGNCMNLRIEDQYYNISSELILISSNEHDRWKLCES